MTTKTPELKPCPFCGGEAEIDESPSKISDYNMKFHAGCTNDECIAYCLTDGFETRKEAATAWNTRAGETTWQDISSAPKDGTRILVYNDSEGGYHTEPYDIGVAEYSTSMGKYHWCSIACCDGVSYYTPTHWMPLPLPPTGEKTLRQLVGEMKND